jgi:hypothetical protein
MIAAELHSAPAARLSAASTPKREIRDMLWLLLATGGDSRIWPDPVTRRNRYGTKTEPAPGEIAFASTTANPVSEESYAAAQRALDRQTGRHATARLEYEEWFDGIRARILDFFESPGSEAILAASGTDAEILAVAVASALSERPLTNILTGPEEASRGMALAAAGRHFSNATPSGAQVTPASAIEGISAAPVEAMFAPVRHGAPRDSQSIDSDVERAVERALGRGRNVLAHVLDTSRTGLSGLTREMARSLMGRAQGRVRIVVDASQLRCSLAQIKRDLDDGFMVIVTGSKFAGGPPFSGALLLPAETAAQLAAAAPLGRGLAAYSAALDWPAPLRSRLAEAMTPQMNVGLGLRWEAALDGIGRVAAIGETLRTRIADRFASEVIERAARLARLQFHSADAAVSSGPRTIVPLTALNERGGLASMAEARSIQTALRESELGPVCHVGQPEALGPRTALCVAASAYTMAGVAARMSSGYCFERAFQPVARDLDRLFDKWSCIERQLRKQGCPRE